jgi:hypothetical protein
MVIDDGDGSEVEHAAGKGCLVKICEDRYGEPEREE